MFIFPETNLTFCGFANDVNGNRVVKLSFIGQKRGFSIQTNGRFTFSTCTPIRAEEITPMRDELVAYIQAYGSKRQANLLRTYFQPSTNEKP